MRATRRYRPEHEIKLTWYDVSLVVVLNSTAAEAIIQYVFNHSGIVKAKFLVSNSIACRCPSFCGLSAIAGSSLGF